MLVIPIQKNLQKDQKRFKIQGQNDMYTNDETDDDATIEDNCVSTIDIDENNPSRLINQLPNDISKLVIHYLPAYRFVGRQGMPLLSKMWEKEDKEGKTKEKRKLSEIMSSCQTPEDALNILSDGSLYDQFKVEELLTIAAFNPELIKKLLSNSLLIDILDHDQLSILGSQDEEIAIHILKSKELVSKLSAENITYLGCKSKKAADFIFANEKLCEKLNGENLVKLGSVNEDNALKILKENNLKSKLSRIQYVRLHAYHEKLALELLNTEKLKGTIESGFLSELGLQRENIAKIIVKDETFRKVRRNEKISLYSAYKEPSIICFEKIKEELTDQQINMFASKYESIALSVLRDPKLRSKLYDLYIGGIHEKVALELFETRRDRIFMLEFGTKHESIAKKIIANKELYKVCGFDNLVKIGSSHEKIAETLLKNKNFCDNLVGISLAKLIKNHRKLIYNVLMDPKLCSLLKKASIKDIAVGVTPRSAKVILDNSKIRNMFAKKLQLKFKTMINISEHIHSLAKELRSVQKDENLHNTNHKHESDTNTEKSTKRPKAF